MTTKFKPGDKVRIKKDADAALREMEAELGQIRQVKECNGLVHVIWNENKTDWYVWFPHELELVTEEAGFNPENLTFDGVEINKEAIKDGDSIKVLLDFDVFIDQFGNERISFYNYSTLVENLKVVAHYPAKKTITINGKQYESTHELEELKNKVEHFEKNCIISGLTSFEETYSVRFNNSIEALNLYYQTRKALEEYISKLEEIKQYGTN